MSEVAAPRRKSLLERFSAIKDARRPCKVMYPLNEVLLLAVCGTMAACDDIVLWGARHLDFLRRLAPDHFGIPCADWLRVVMKHPRQRIRVERPEDIVAGRVARGRPFIEAKQTKRLRREPASPTEERDRTVGPRQRRRDRQGQYRRQRPLAALAATSPRAPQHRKDTIKQDYGGMISNRNTP